MAIVHIPKIYSKVRKTATAWVNWVLPHCESSHKLPTMAQDVHNTLQIIILSSTNVDCVLILPLVKNSQLL